jgi:hypothetical protein
MGDMLYEIVHDTWAEYRRDCGEPNPIPCPSGDRSSDEQPFPDGRGSDDQSRDRQGADGTVSWEQPLAPARGSDEQQRSATDVPAIPGPRGSWKLLRLLAVGDVADVHLARLEAGRGETGPERVVKITRVPEGVDILDNERTVLTSLLARTGDMTWSRYLPALVDSFAPAGRPGERVHLFEYDPGLFTLEQVHDQHPALDGRHLAWIFNRLLTVLGYVHRAGTVHGAVLPGHVLVHPADHGVRLIGWGQSVPVGGRMQVLCTRYRDWYPPEVEERQPVSAATDLFLAARCLVYLAGGDVPSGWMPDAIPAPLQRFLRSCLAGGVRMRPRDAWELQDEFGALLRSLYGPPSFHPLTMTPRNSHG